MGVMANLIFDRTQNDVANKTKKGYYNSEDLNRVQEAMDYLYTELTKMGYVIEYKKMPYWDKTGEPSTRSMDQYLSNLNAIKTAIKLMKETPNTPETMENLTYLKANDIEKIIFDVEKVLNSMRIAFLKANQYFSHSDAVMYWPELSYYLADKNGVILADKDGYLLLGKVN